MHKSIKHNYGFSIIEVMTSLVLGLVVLLMVVQLFVNTKNNHAQNDRISETLESGRYAMRQISTDLQEAGFLGGVLDSSNVKLDTGLGPVSTDCGTAGEVDWAYDVDTYRSMQFDYLDSATTATADHTCIDAAEFSPGPDNAGTDVLVVKRVYNQPIDPATGPTAEGVYLRSDFSTACLWYYSSGTPTPAGSTCPLNGITDWKYLVHVYYIRNYASKPGDGIPTLCRKTLGVSGGKPTMTELCLAEGIERFHVMFGIDTDNDGVANEFKSSALTLADLRAHAVSARIYVLARAKYPDNTRGTNNQFTFVNNKTYTLGDVVQLPLKDQYYRRLYSTTVMLRNPMYASLFQ